MSGHVPVSSEDDGLRPRDRRCRLRQHAAGRGSRRTCGSRSSRAISSGARASTAAASRRRCSSTPADVAQAVRHAGRYGIDAELRGADWPAIRERIFGRIDPMPERAVAYRRRRASTCTSGTHGSSGRVCSRSTARSCAASTSSSRSDHGRVSRRSLVSTAVAYHTSDTMMRVDALPDVDGGARRWFRRRRDEPRVRIARHRRSRS